MKHFLLSTIFLLVLFLSSSTPVQAQYPGTYGCFISETTGACTLYLPHGCADGYMPGDCSTISPIGCANYVQFPCHPGEFTCGNENESCCEDFSCGSNLYCNTDTNTCEKCGLEGNQCCPLPAQPCGLGILNLVCNSENKCEPRPHPPPPPPGPLPTETTIKCAGPGGTLGIDTAIGCIPIETQTLLSKFFIIWTIGISGGTGLFMFGYSAYLIMIGSRDPKKKLIGKDIFWSTLSGMIMLALSIYFLNAIGIGILGLVQIGT